MSSVSRCLYLLTRRSRTSTSLLRARRYSPNIVPSFQAVSSLVAEKHGLRGADYHYHAYRHDIPTRDHCTVSIGARREAEPKAVIFDLGGVVVPSPQRIFDEFEKKYNLKEGSLVETIKATGNGGAFAKMERGQLSVEQFCAPFRNEYLSQTGQDLSLERTQEFIQHLSDFTNTSPHPQVLKMFASLKRKGIKVAILTNNFRRDDGSTVFPREELKDVDVVVESCVEGLKKPEQAIFDLTLKKLGVDAHQTVFLDDLGSNLKTARLMGITTIKVTDIPKAMESLECILDNKDHTHQLHIPGTSKVSDKLSLPMDHLIGYLKERHGLEQNQGEPVLRQFRHGQSNPTYYLSYGGEEMVLRKKPPGKLLPSAHAVEREYKVMDGTRKNGVPIPELMSLCEDSSVIGTPFYLMKYVPGHVLKDPSLSTLAAEERMGYYKSMCHVLAAIHSVDVEKAGLKDFGKKENYICRQVIRWSKQYESSKTHDIPSMDKLMSWLPQHTPPDRNTTIVHGDFRLDNLIFAVDQPKVLAVLDWELSTLGDPISDLAYCCMTYHLPLHQPHLKGVLGVDPASHGIPSEEEFVSMYCQLTNTADISKHWNYYLAFTFFRVAAILQGVYKRSLQDQASADNARVVGLMAEKFADKGAEFAVKQDQQLITGTPPSPSIFKRGNTQRRSFSTLGSAPRTGGPGDSLLSPGSRRLLSSNERGVPIGLITGDTDDFPPKLGDLRNKLLDFMEEVVYPAEHTLSDHQTSHDRWKPHPLVEQMKSEAKSEGLWNLFLPLETDSDAKFGAGLTNLEYSHLAEIMGRSLYASEALNCSPPDTGNMEVLVKYATEKQQAMWLTPLLAGEIRSCFAMTEPLVASSDATNIQSSIVHDGNSYVLNGRKWWISGAMDPRCKLCIFMGKTDPSGPKHQQQSMILVPMDTPGVNIIRPLTVFGLDDSPGGHAEMEFKDVRVPLDNILLGEGRGFEIAQGRLGPGRIHHCMRLIGMAERSLELMACRVQERTAFGKLLSEQGTILSDLAQSRLEVDQARLLTLKASHLMDVLGNKDSRRDIAMIKVAAPRMAQRVIDRAIQAHGAMGLSADRPLAQFFSWARILRFADGPDEVHMSAVGKMELKRNN